MGASRRSTELSRRGQPGEKPQRFMSTWNVGNGVEMKGENRREGILRAKAVKLLGLTQSSLEDRVTSLEVCVRVS